MVSKSSLTRTIQKIGKSYGIYLPAQLVRAYGWKKGDIVIFEPYDRETILIRKFIDKEQLGNVEVLKGLTQKNQEQKNG